MRQYDVARFRESRTFLHVLPDSGDVGFQIKFRQLFFLKRKPMLKKANRSREPMNLDDEESVYAALKPTLQEVIVSLGQLNRTSAEFLKTDVETALLFSSIALQTEDLPKKQRNRQNARRGYDTILRLAGRIRLSNDDEQLLSKKLGRLKSELQSLGEVF
jgi:hypothetical protein